MTELVAYGSAVVVEWTEPAEDSSNDALSASVE
jgi:hypothetical protein